MKFRDKEMENLEVYVFRQRLEANSNVYFEKSGAWNAWGVYSETRRYINQLLKSGSIRKQYRNRINEILTSINSSISNIESIIDTHYREVAA